MQTSTHRSSRFQRATWKQGELWSVLSQLQRQIHCDVVSVKFGFEPTWHTEDEIDDVYEVTELPIGDNSIAVQYVRKSTAADNISHLDVMTLGLHSTDTLAIVFRSAETHYDVDVFSGSEQLAEAALRAIKEQLSLVEIPRR